MKPKEKAVRLVDRYLDEVFNEVDINYPLELPKRLAIIAVNEIINSNPHSNPMNTNGFSTMAYWMEVKQEIDKL